MRAKTLRSTKQLLPNTPENKLAAGITYAPDGWNFSFDVRWVDEFRWAAGPFQVQVESYTTADLALNYDLAERFTLGLNATNLFDKAHSQSFGGDLLGRRILGSVMVRWQANPASASRSAFKTSSSQARPFDSAAPVGIIAFVHPRCLD